MSTLTSNFINPVTRPTLLLDEHKCKANIAAMAEKARRLNLQFRPHFKTHQSHEIGRWFRAHGVDKITVSSLSMASYFALDGWNDITVAFPVNVLEFETINMLAARIKLNLLVESVESIKLLNNGLHHDVNFFIKIDAGYHRTGISYDDLSLINAVLTAASHADHLRFIGFLTHAGNSYEARGREEIMAVHHESTDRLRSLKMHYVNDYPEMIISVGDTPTCSTMEDFSGVDEIRPGNFVFYDLMQVNIGSCSFDQIAVAMACPVVAIHKERNEIVIYGGAVHFSKEGLKDPRSGIIYGKVAEHRETFWGNAIEGFCLVKLSQEHGILHVPGNIIDRYKTGDILTILPVHSCLTADAMKSYLTTEGGLIRLIQNAQAQR